jgi:hypothetical protein
MRTETKYPDWNYFTRKPELDNAGLSERLYELGWLAARELPERGQVRDGMEANDGKVRMP